MNSVVDHSIPEMNGVLGTLIPKVSMIERFRVQKAEGYSCELREDVDGDTVGNRRTVRGYHEGG
jgi:hypothetical protein